MSCKITPQMAQEARQFDSAESFLRAGGLSISTLDNAAFGFTSDDIIEIWPSNIRIKWRDDLINVLYEIKHSGLSRKKWAEKISLETPVEISYEKSRFYLEDGHHRYTAAKILGKPLTAKIQVKDRPLDVLGKGMKYDDFIRCVWNKAKQLKETAIVQKVIISESAVQLIENYQLAKKYLGDKLTQEELDHIKENCKYPQYMSIYAWCYLEDVKQDQILWALNHYYADTSILRLKTLSDPVGVFKSQDSYFGAISGLIMKRKDVLLKLKLIKSEYLRNLQKFLNTDFTFYGLKTTLEQLEEIISMLKTYDDYPDSELKTKILRTAFSSKATSLKDIFEALYDGYDNDLHFKAFESSEDVKKQISEQGVDATIFYDHNNILLLRVDSQEDLRALTCNAKYCFSRSGSYGDWNTYAGGDYVFLLFDFNYDFPDYLTVILPHLYAYTADNMPVGEDEPDSRKNGIALLKKFLSKTDFQNYYRESKHYLQDYRQRISWR